MADENSQVAATESAVTTAPEDAAFDAALTGPLNPQIQTVALQEKPIVEPTATPAPPKVQAPARVFRFVKNMSPGVPVNVGRDEPVKFHRPRKQDGRLSSSGEFRTGDAELADALRVVAKENPSLYIFEVN